MTSAPDVRIGIVTYDTPEDLEGCLRTLPAAIGRLDAEVVVIDNGSESDADAAVASQFPVRVLRLEHNVGYPRAMNLALAGTQAPVLIALNPDTVLPPGSLERLVQVVTADDSIGLVGPRIVGSDGHHQHSIRVFPSPAVALTTGLVPPGLRRYLPGRRLWLEEHQGPDGMVDVDWMVGALHVIRRAALQREGVYSERSFMYAEDMEVCWHLHRRGWRVAHDPSVTVAHVGNVTGERTFGSRREERWLDAVYDWYVATRGPAAARRWAAANVLGLSVKRAVLRASSGSPDHQAFVRSLLTFHARRLVRPQGDLHSRRMTDGRPPPTPVVALDSAQASRSDVV